VLVEFFGRLVEDLTSIADEIARLRDRMYDFVLGRSEMFPHAPSQDDLRTEILCDDPRVVAVGTHNRWARRRNIDLADLIEEPWALAPPNTLNHAGMAEAFRKRGCDMPKIRLETSSVHLRAQLAASGQFITALPKSMAERHSLKVLPIGIQPSSLAIVTLKNRTLNPVVERFIEQVREYTRPLREGQPTPKR
jgi:DNA-binding transcriptional LysR family regulator